MAKRTYTPDEKSAALELYRTDGPRAAAAATGIPIGTISSWARRNGVQTVCNEATAARVQAKRLRWEDRRLDIANEIGELAELAMARAKAELRDGSARDGKDAATAMAICVDKAQLLTGAATGRTEHLDPRARIERLRDELAEKRAAKATA